VLRQADDADPTQPAPGTAQLEALIDGARRAGLETTYTVTGDPVPLPAAVDLAAYRIVQESLTNAIRHAGPATAAVSLDYHHAELRIEVTDTGHGQPTGAVAGQGGGHGLAGMRERAATVGGIVETGSRPGGGFRVAARLPLGCQRTGPPPGPSHASSAEGGRTREGTPIRDGTPVRDGTPARDGTRTQEGARP